MSKFEDEGDYQSCVLTVASIQRVLPHVLFLGREQGKGVALFLQIVRE